jgi:UDP-glucose 6-dehydrogenase
MPNAQQELGYNARFSPSLDDCIRVSDVIVITTPWKQFREIQASSLNHGSRRKVVVDAWRLLEQTDVSQIADYITLGVGI